MNPLKLMPETCHLREFRIKMPVTGVRDRMEHYTTINGRAVRYRDTGGGRTPGSTSDARDGHVIVLLHAFPLTAEMWAPQLADLPSAWRAVAPDLRGFGGSSRRQAGLGGAEVPARGMDDYASDVLALLDTLEIPAAVIGGLSMGGYVAFSLFRLAPTRVRALLLADTRAEADADAARQNRMIMLATLEASGPPAIADAMLPKLLALASRREHPDLERDVRRLIESNSREAIADAIRCLMSRPDSRPLLSSIAVPVQLIAGSDDELTPVALHEEMQASLPDASLTIIEGAGHLSNLERPDVFNRTLSRFLVSLR
jgi:pimeloyl-ACP methyl ester carboxylesterase